MTRPPLGCDAVLLLAFGGPERMDDVRPFLENVVRGQSVPAERLDEVARHYEALGGRSPINAITAAQTSALSRALAARGVSIPVCFAMRNWSPSIRDVLAALAVSSTSEVAASEVAASEKRVLAVILTAHASEAGIDRYTEAVDAALHELGRRAPRVDYVEGFHAHPGFVAAHCEHVLSAFQHLPEALRDEAKLVFTAHSIPVTMAERGHYVEQLHETARLVATAAGVSDYRVAYQSRSGSPRDPWLEPDVSEEIRAQAAAGTRALVISPIGFVCDHVEVLYDLDVEAKQLATSLGVTLVRARAANDHEGFIECLAELVFARLSLVAPAALQTEP